MTAENSLSKKASKVKPFSLHVIVKYFSLFTPELLTFNRQARFAQRSSLSSGLQPSPLRLISKGVQNLLLLRVLE